VAPCFSSVQPRIIGEFELDLIMTAQLAENWLNKQKVEVPGKYRNLLTRAVHTLEGNILMHCPPREGLPDWMQHTWQELDPAGAQHLLLKCSWVGMMGEPFHLRWKERRKSQVKTRITSL
jgi:hypothetical protein